MIDQSLQVAGRLHPILVHFPIAMVLVAAGIEVLRAALRRPEPARTSINMLAIGVLTAGAAVASGWLNADYERSRSDTTLELHRWIAIGGGCAALAALLLGFTAGARRTGLTAAFRATLLVSAGAIGFAGHLGGSMVYGEGYLLAPFKESSRLLTPSKTSAPIGQGSPSTPGTSPDSSPDPLTVHNVVFDRDVLPILETHCIECHGAGKAKAGLRLDSLDHASAADEFVIAPGDPEASDLFARIVLPEDEDGAMPPEGPRLTDTEIETVRVWIASLGTTTPDDAQRGAAPGDGATADEPGTPSDAPDSAEASVETEWPGGTRGDSPAELQALESARELGAHVGAVSADSNLIEINASLAGKAFSDESFARVLPLAPRVAWLDLSGTSITDASLIPLATFTSLERLNLSGTAITDAGAPSIGAVKSLRVLNIGRTTLGDSALDILARTESLERLYAWQSRISAAGAARAVSVRPDLSIDLGTATLPADPAEPPQEPKPGE